MAAILAFADLNSDPEAAKRFNCGTKTIRERRKAAATGKEPDLAALVQAEKDRAAQKHGDAVDAALEAMLKRLLELAPTASIGDAITAAEALGGLKIQRDWFDGDATAPGAQAGRKDPAARALAGRGSGAESSTAVPPVH